MTRWSVLIVMSFALMLISSLALNKPKKPRVNKSAVRRSLRSLFDFAYLSTTFDRVVGK